VWIIKKNNNFILHRTLISCHFVNISWLCVSLAASPIYPACGGFIDVFEINSQLLTASIYNTGFFLFAVNSSILVQFLSTTHRSRHKIMRNRVRYKPKPGRICENRKTRLSQGRVFSFSGFQYTGIAVIKQRSDGFASWITFLKSSDFLIRPRKAFSFRKWLWR